MWTLNHLRLRDSTEWKLTGILLTKTMWARKGLFHGVHCRFRPTWNLRVGGILKGGNKGWEPYTTDPPSKQRIKKNCDILSQLTKWNMIFCLYGAFLKNSLSKQNFPSPHILTCFSICELLPGNYPNKL